MIVPSGSALESLSDKVSKKKTKVFNTPKDPVDFMMANQSAVIATAEAMGVDLTKIDFSQFREWKAPVRAFEKEELTVVEDYAHHPLRSVLLWATGEESFLIIGCAWFFNLIDTVAPALSHWFTEMSQVDDIQFFPPMVHLRNMIRKEAWIRFLGNCLHA